MPKKTARIPDELAAEIDRRRGLVPFERYVRELLRLGLDVQADAHRPVTESSPEIRRGVPPVSETWRR